MSSNSISQANRDYEPGEIIVQCPKPLVHVTKYEHRLFTCEQCLRKVESTLLCPACRKVYYCTRVCQDRHWMAIHHLECPILVRHPPLQFENKGIDYMQRLTLRLYLLMTTNEAIRSTDFILHNGLTRRLDDMEYHPNDLKDTPQFKGILNYFQLYRIDSYDADLLLRAYGILHINSFGIDSYHSVNEQADKTEGASNSEDVIIEQSGTGLYVEASVFDHSCCPNAAASGDGLALEIRALSPIRKGEQIYIDYLQDILPKAERQSGLRERYFFTCQCARGCADELNGGGQKEEVPFDGSLDYQRYAVLGQAIDSLLANDGASERNEINWRQLYRFWKERLRLQEMYYGSSSRYHPTLSLFYREFLRFLLVNQHRLADDEPANQQPHEKTRKKKKKKKKKKANKALPVEAVNSTACLAGSEIEVDLLEFGAKAKEHLAITHGVTHCYYTRLFGCPGKEG